MSAIESEELLELTDKFVDQFNHMFNKKNRVYVMDIEQFKYTVQLLIRKLESE